MSNENTVDTEENEELPSVSSTARFGASIGITIMRGNRTGWPKFSVDDQILPGETVGEFMNRVNDLALEGAFRTAENTVMLIENDIENNRKDK
jgi:hypothetical protein